MVASERGLCVCVCVCVSVCLCLCVCVRQCVCVRACTEARDTTCRANSFACFTVDGIACCNDSQCLLYEDHGVVHHHQAGVTLQRQVMLWL